MNVILTSACNKACSFCFAKPYVTDPEKEILPLEKAKQTVYNQLQMYHTVSLLGGEPTQYPYFVELAEYIRLIQAPTDRVLLISNFLFKDKAIYEAIEQTTSFTFLLNVAEMSESQMELFLANLGCIGDRPYRPAITVSVDKPIGYYTAILDQLYAHTPFPSIRLSTANPLKDTKTFEYMVEKEFDLYIDHFKDIYKWAKKRRIEPSFDCGTPYCLIEKDEELEQLVQEAVKEADKIFGCGIGSPSDLAPTGNTIVCYPRSDLTAQAASFSSIDDLKLLDSSITDLKRIASNKQVRAECIKCRFYPLTCRGPCLGYAA